MCARYVSQKSDGSLYYQRRVPKGLEKHHGGKSLIRESLQTKSPHVAAKKAAKLAAEHDALWKHLKDPSAEDLGVSTRETRNGAEALMKHLGVNPGDAHSERWSHHDPLDDHLEHKHGEDYLEARHGEHRSDESLFKVLTPVEKEAMRLAYSKPDEKRYLLSDARDLYLELHKRGENQRFKADTQRAIQHVIDAVGDLPLGSYTRQQARDVVSFLSASGNATSTVRRRLRAINAVINKALLEFDLTDASNPFNKLDIKGEGDDAHSRQALHDERTGTHRAALQRDE